MTWKEGNPKVSWANYVLAAIILVYILSFVMLVAIVPDEHLIGGYLALNSFLIASTAMILPFLDNETA